MVGLKINAPIYRAKKMDSDEYVEGYIFPDDNANITKWRIQSQGVSQIDPSTLAIHFHDMLDSENTKIFASLSEDGEGGDILYYLSDYWGEIKETLHFNDNRLVRRGINSNTYMYKDSLAKQKVTGIQK